MMKTTKAQRATMRVAFEKAGLHGSLALLDDLDEAEAATETLRAHIMEIADEALGLQPVDSDPVALLHAIEKRFHEHRIAASQAEAALARAREQMEDLVHGIRAVRSQPTR